MNPKNALFLSASLTAFVLAVLFAVVTKVTNTPSVAAAAPQVAQVATAIPNTAVPPTDAPTETVLPTATDLGPLGPEEAANLAAKSINRQDVYSVETFSLNGVDSYKVVFSSGDVVYIGMDRQVLQASQIKPVTVSLPAVTAKPTKKHRSSNDSSSSNSSSSNVQPPAPTSPPTGGGEGGGGDD